MINSSAMKTIGERKTFSCSVCSYSSDRKMDLTGHMRMHLKKRFQCKICLHKTTYKCKMKEHMLTHLGNKSFQCSLCSYASVRKSDVNRHLKTVHSLQEGSEVNNRSEKCPTKKDSKAYFTSDKCQTVQSPEEFDVITNEKHTLKKSKPIIIGEDILESLTLKLDRGKRSLKPVNKAYFSSEKSMKMCSPEDVDNVSTNEKHSTVHSQKHKKQSIISENVMKAPTSVLKNGNHKCRKCCYVTESKEKFSKHILVHSRKNNNFDCSECGYKTTNKYEFKFHLLNHVGLKPYTCSKCTFTTVKKCYLMRHIKGHEDRRFQCRYCNTKTAFRYQMKEHELIHLGIRSFKCAFCAYSSMRKGDMNRHLKNVHDIGNPSEIHMVSDESFKKNFDKSDKINLPCYVLLEKLDFSVFENPYSLPSAGIKREIDEENNLHSSNDLVSQFYKTFFQGEANFFMGENNSMEVIIPDNLTDSETQDN